MKEPEAIRARVEAFIADFAECNARFYPPESLLEELDVDAVRSAFKVIIKRHFLSDENVCRVGMAIGYPAQHSPAEESIVSVVERADGHALVETQVSHTPPHYYEYTLQKVGADWRIADLQVLFSGNDDKIRDVDLAALARSFPNPSPTSDFPTGLDQLFRGSLHLRTTRGQVRTRVATAGTIQAPSGFLTGDDPGNWQWGAAIFDLPIPAGNHVIELVIDEGLQIVGAARIVFEKSSQRGVFACAGRTLSSDHPTSSTHVIGVDGGIIGVADAGAISALSRRQRERLCGQLSEALRANGRSAAAFVPLGEGAHAWAIQSGCGDGGYAAYWNLADDGRPLSLIFDFADLALPVWERLLAAFRTEASGGVVEDRELARRGIEVRCERQGQQRYFHVGCDRETRIKLRDSHRHVVFDSEGSGCSVCGTETTYYLPPGFPGLLSGELEIQLYLGHRYDIIETP